MRHSSLVELNVRWSYQQLSIQLLLKQSEQAQVVKGTRILTDFDETAVQWSVASAVSAVQCSAFQNVSADSTISKQINVLQIFTNSGFSNYYSLWFNRKFLANN